MSFNDLTFYPFAAGLLLLLLIIQWFVKKPSARILIRKLVLAAASFYIIYCYKPVFCLSTAAVILVTFVGGLLIERAGEKSKSVLSGVFVTVLVLFLATFKYLNFILDSIGQVSGINMPVLRIMTPIGISFYVFTAISYILDVAWGKCQAERDPVNLVLFLAFFPKLLCGPLVRGTDFLKQLREDRRITPDAFALGIQIFAFGFFKKAVLANHITRFLDSVFFAPSAYSMSTLWLAMLCNMPALYFDFSGYSDMAIGLSKIIGYDLQPNFNLPFITTNISDFWNRWHMTLTSWLQTYLFNPLAVHFRRIMARQPREFRKKHKLLPECGAAVITFLISGIWHGVGFNFAIFGLLHGIFYAIQKVYAQRKKKSGRAFHGKAGYVVGVLCNFILINLIQVFFRTSSVSEAFQFYKELFLIHPGVFFPSFWCIAGMVMLSIATCMAFCRQKKKQLPEPEGYYPVQDLKTIRGLTVFFFFVGLTLALGYFGDTYFVYEQF